MRAFTPAAWTSLPSSPIARSLWPRRARTVRRGRREPDARSLRALPHAQANWLDDFALFMAVKEAHGHAAVDRVGAGHRASRSGGDREMVCALRARDPAAHAHAVPVLRAVAARARRLPRAIDSDHGRPARSSSRTTAPTSGHGRSCFVSTTTAMPTVLAGVPPDYFSATGQLWGNPHYRWDVLRRIAIRLVDRALSRAAGAGRCESASITSADSRRRGKCRPDPRRP